MSSFVHILDQRRLIGPGGSTVGGSMAFYYTGTDVLAPIYQDSSMGVPLTNPVSVGAGQIIPSIFLDKDIIYRRVITYDDGTTDSEDPLGVLFSEGEIGIPVGTVIDFSGPIIPSNYLYCAGQEVSRSTYSELYAVVGTTYGLGNGVTTFNVPDYRGRVIAGKDNMNGSTAGRLSFSVTGTSLGATGGVDKVSLTEAQLAAHSHGVTDPGHTHQVIEGAIVGLGTLYTSGDDLTDGIATHSVTSSNTTGITIANTGTGDDHDNTQPTAVANKIIKCFSTTALSLINLIPGYAAKVNASAVGISEIAVDMGTFTGGTIPDNVTAKVGMQALETSLETKQPRLVWSAAEYGILADDSTDNASTINSLISVVASVGGGTIQFPAGIIRHGTTIDLKYPRVKLVGTGEESFHDAGTTGLRTVFKSTFAGTSVKIRTPYSGTAQKNWGAEVSGIVLDGNGIGLKALEIDSVAGIFVDTYATGFVGTDVYEVKCGVTGTDLAEACDVQFSRMLFRARQIDSAGQKTSNIVKLNGSSNANVSLNRGPLHGISIYAQHWTGNVLEGISGDNNDITVVGIRAGGAGNLIYCHAPTAAIPVGFDSNCFRYVSGSGGIYQEGTDTAGATAGIRNRIEFWDDGNGTPAPTSGMASFWRYNSGLGRGEVGSDFSGIVLADNLSDAKLQRAAKGSESVRIHNTSSNHSVITDGTNTWGINIDGSNGNLRFSRSAGSGIINLGGGVDTQIYRAGFQGTSPISKPTVVGSKGSNVALASLLTALANYGLITDSST